MNTKIRHERRIRRHQRIRAKICGTAERPRLFAFRSAKHIYVQLIDDEKGKIVASASDVKSKQGSSGGKTKTDRAKEAGKSIAKKAKELKIDKVVFDRGGYKYHGRIKALAEGAREEGLKF